ncbi:hypothetical protein [Microbacterium imperiale]|uniref:Uncharacterized protein n=1 Tax=Microbacterium imperiale TaxID=33884 RepID=A0A9W6HHF5_9MICO|nr:hypothetical protein [Microbacterium imperiale]MBP2419175.1 hypothetical protein [Microbacterium imperiale]MDS0198951.1 hypothetical protein [Microbacterium imperiale]BFE39517.1 hypothetical protein GCM10017544_04730 [Microbacterium imperiale]GLJ80155.1 hypothetical protein GCM10017586_18380 [Microbacterium imperiale]
MSDLGRFLPLSQRSPGGDAGVSSDRREQTSAVVLLAAALLEHATPGDARAFAREAGLEGDLDQVPGGDLTGLAAAIASGRRRTIRDLTAAARAYLARAGTGGTPLPAEVSGAVALHASASAPFARRAAIAGHTVRASDAGWSFGRGPEITATADAIVAFLTGLSDTPPRRRPDH